MIDQTLDTSDDPDAFRTALVGFMRTQGAEFGLRVQLCTDLDRMPVEDAAVTWPEDESPYAAVARLTLPPRDAYSPARQTYFDGVLAFRPAHSLAAGPSPARLHYARPARRLFGIVGLSARAQRPTADRAGLHRRRSRLNWA